MSQKTRVTTTSAPAAAHAFSQGVVKGGLLQVSGQGPMDPATSTYVSLGDVQAQTTRTLENVCAILEAAGSGMEDLLMLRVYLTTREHFSAMNEAYAEFLQAHCPSGVLPCRTTVFVELPHADMLVEIDGLAVVG